MEDIFSQRLLTSVLLICQEEWEREWEWVMEEERERRGELGDWVRELHYVYLVVYSIFGLYPSTRPSLFLFVCFLCLALIEHVLRFEPQRGIQRLRNILFSLLLLLSTSRFSDKWVHGGVGGYVLGGWLMISTSEAVDDRYFHGAWWAVCSWTLLGTFMAVNVCVHGGWWVWRLMCMYMAVGEYEGWWVSSWRLVSMEVDEYVHGGWWVWRLMYMFMRLVSMEVDEYLHGGWWVCSWRMVTMEVDE